MVQRGSISGPGRRCAGNSARVFRARLPHAHQAAWPRQICIPARSSAATPRLCGKHGFCRYRGASDLHHLIGRPVEGAICPPHRTARWSALCFLQLACHREYQRTQLTAEVSACRSPAPRDRDASLLAFCWPAPRPYRYLAALTRLRTGKDFEREPKRTRVRFSSRKSKGTPTWPRPKSSRG